MGVSLIKLTLPFILLWNSWCCHAFVYPSLPTRHLSTHRRPFVSTKLRSNPTATETIAHENTNNYIKVESTVSLHKMTIQTFEDKLKGYDIPNKLTALRMLGVPAIIATFLLEMKATSCGIFVAASLTDFVDGYLARRWGQESSFGAFLDPVADKLMVATALILLTTAYPVPLFTVPVALILCREIAVSALREWMAEKGIRAVVKVGYIGKVKTALQMISTALFLFAMPGRTRDVDLCSRWGINKFDVFVVAFVTLLGSTLASLISGAQYFMAAWPQITQAKPSQVSKQGENQIEQKLK